MIGRDFPAYPIGIQQLPGHARILGQYAVSPGQRVQRPQRNIPQIADRRGNNVETRLWRLRCGSAAASFSWYM